MSECDCATDFCGNNIDMKLNLKDTHIFGSYVLLHSLSQCYQISQETLLRLTMAKRLSFTVNVNKIWYKYLQT